VLIVSIARFLENYVPQWVYFKACGDCGLRYHHPSLKWAIFHPRGVMAMISLGLSEAEQISYTPPQKMPSSRMLALISHLRHVGHLTPAAVT